MHKEVVAYYAKGQAIGKRGDFITAPEISQIFGELIAVRMLAQWQRHGKPSPFVFMELGTGRGTLMADMVRVLTRLSPQFLRGARWHMLEKSHQFAVATTQAVSKINPNIRLCYHSRLANIPKNMPQFFVANEFFDALPIDQYRLINNKWHVAVVENEHRAYRFTKNEPKDVPTNLKPSQTWHKMRSGVALMRDLARRLANSSGSGIIIDYGSSNPTHSDNLNHIKSHKSKGSVLKGGGDISADVDFSQLVEAIKPFGLNVNPIQSQAEFLYESGFKQRLEMLAVKNPARFASIAQSASRLVAPPMGDMFKVMLLSSV